MFVNSIKTCIKKYFKIKGRASRSEFWYFMLLVGIFSLCSLVFCFDLIFYHLPSAFFFYFIFSLVLLFFLIPSITVTCRRLHDIGKAAPWYFLNFIPFVGSVILLIWCAKKSDGPNRFGELNKC